jgi:hypothetical protein
VLSKHPRRPCTHVQVRWMHFVISLPCANASRASALGALYHVPVPWVHSDPSSVYLPSPPQCTRCTFVNFLSDLAHKRLNFYSGSAEAFEGPSGAAKAHSTAGAGNVVAVVFPAAGSTTFGRRTRGSRTGCPSMPRVQKTKRCQTSCKLMTVLVISPCAGC